MGTGLYTPPDFTIILPLAQFIQFTLASLLLLEHAEYYKIYICPYIIYILYVL